VEAYYNAYAEMYEPDGEGDFRLRPGVQETPSPLFTELENMFGKGVIQQVSEQEVEEFFKRIRSRS